MRYHLSAFVAGLAFAAALMLSSPGDVAISFPLLR